MALKYTVQGNRMQRSETEQRKLHRRLEYKKNCPFTSIEGNVETIA